MNDIFKKAFSLVLNKNGKVSTQDVDELLHHYKVDKNIDIDKSAFVIELALAKKFYSEQEKSLFVCTNVTCKDSTYLEQSESSLNNLAKNLGCQVIKTGCHWQCEYASVVTLKTGEYLTSYTGCNSKIDWENTLTQIRKRLESHSQESSS